MAPRLRLPAILPLLSPARATPPARLRRCFSSDTTSTTTTHFGFQTVTDAEKTRRVGAVFTSVAESYDRMNDLMSFGWHRVWKDHFVASLNPGLSSSSSAAPPSTSPSPPPSPLHILDVAGGTGDIAFRHLHHAHVLNANPAVTVTCADINPAMLAVGAARADALLPPGQRAALSFLEADAQSLTRAGVPAGSVDLYTVAFGIRNFTDVRAGLREAFRVLRPGGVFACLEFGKVAGGGGGAAAALLDALYQRWSFGAIPLIGQVVAGDRDSYQYLVESIARFPAQDAFRDMIVEAGFEVSSSGGGRGYENLTGGVVAIHRGMKPL